MTSGSGLLNKSSGGPTNMAPKRDTVCFLCGENRGFVLEEHHALPRRYNGEDSGENMYIVCSNCHSAVEAMYDDAFYDRFAKKLGIEEGARERIDALNEADEGAVREGWITDNRSHKLTCKAVYDESLRTHGVGDEWVPLDLVSDRIRRYLGNPGTINTGNKLWGNLLEHISDSLLERGHVDGNSCLRCTGDASTRILASGSSVVSGNSDHRILTRDIYHALTKLGLVVGIPFQDGTDLPDAYGRLDDIDRLQFDAEDVDAGAVANAVDEFEENHPLLYRLTEASDVAIEVECSSATKPAQTLQNLANARNSGRRCLFACREDTASVIWNVLAESPRCMREYSAPGRYQLYNTSKMLSIGGELVYRPKTSHHTTWVYDERGREYKLHDAEEGTLARFDGPEDLFTDIDAYPRRESDEVDDGAWTPIKYPFVPEHEINELPQPMELMPLYEAWDILVVDDGDVFVYDDGEYITLDELLDHETIDGDLSFLEEL